MFDIHIPSHNHCVHRIYSGRMSEDRGSFLHLLLQDRRFSEASRRDRHFRCTEQRRSLFRVFFSAKKRSIISMNKTLLHQTSQDQADPSPTHRRTFYRVNEAKLQKFYSTIIQQQQQQFDSSFNRSDPKSEQENERADSTEDLRFTSEICESTDTPDSISSSSTEEMSHFDRRSSPPRFPKCRLYVRHILIDNTSDEESMSKTKTLLK